MKLLIAYDGSESAVAALSDLRRAGLPNDVEALVYVADVWLPSSRSEFTRAIDTRRQLAAGISSFAPALRTTEEERALSREAGRRFKMAFPTWEVGVEAAPGMGLPTSELVRKAFAWNADLIVVGTNSRPADALAGLGYSFLKVLAEAPCSVRVSRNAVGADKTAVRIIACVDGLPGSESAVSAIASRWWPEGSEVLIVTPDDATAALAREAADALRLIGLQTVVKVRVGETHRVLREEARRWEADCIFVGPDGEGGESQEREQPEAVDSLAVSAPCSVEVARTQLWATTGAYLPLASAANHSTVVGAG